jgi:hypothetical protein
MKYCGTAAKAGGKQRKQTLSCVMEVSCLLETGGGTDKQGKRGRNLNR